MDVPYRTDIWLFLHFHVHACSQYSDCQCGSTDAKSLCLGIGCLHSASIGRYDSPPLFGYINGELGQLHAAKLGLDSDAIQATIGTAMSESLSIKVSYSIGRQWTFLWFALALIPASLCCFIAALTAKRDVSWVEEQEKKDQEPEEEEKAPLTEESGEFSLPPDTHDEMPPT